MGGFPLENRRSWAGTSETMLTVTSPAPQDIWQEMVAADPEATVFQTPQWTSCVCDAGGYVDSSRLYETSTGRRLLLPMVRARGRPGSLASEASMPKFWGAAGLVSPGQLHMEDVAEILGDLAAAPGVLMSIRPYFPQAAAWERARPQSFVILPHLVHVLDLEGGFEQVWGKRFGTKARGGVRKAERAGLTVEMDTTGRLVPQFYDTYLRWHEHQARERGTSPTLARRLAQRREPLRKFTLVARRLQDACRVWVASHGGEPIAAVMALVAGRHAYYWRGFSEREAAARTRANDLLQRLIIEDACLAGCRYYNMGESGSVGSLMDFKKKFGAQPLQTPEFRRERLPLTRLSHWQDAARRSAAGLLIAARSRRRVHSA
jgi:hypothetical protein